MTALLPELHDAGAPAHALCQALPVGSRHTRDQDELCKVSLLFCQRRIMRRQTVAQNTDLALLPGNALQLAHHIPRHLVLHQMSKRKRTLAWMVLAATERVAG